MDSRFKVHAFFEQFPFLATLVDDRQNTVIDTNKVEEVNVARVDYDFLDKEPRYNGATGSLVGIEDSERIFLLDKNGNLLIEVGQGGYCTHNEAHRDNEEWSGETVGETLLRTDPTKVHYAVVVHTGYEIHDHHSVGGYAVTVYKPPKGFTLKSWVEEVTRRAKELIAATLAEIDADA